MRVWRIGRADRDPLDGLGGTFVSARWNPRGIRMVYTSAHLSLAILEKLVHTDPDLLPDRLAAFEIEIPGDPAGQEALSADDLPADWRAQPPAASTQELGRAWTLDRRRSGVLAVPSAVVPRERNYLLNPMHPDAARWKVVQREPFELDARLIRSP